MIYIFDIIFLSFFSGMLWSTFNPVASRMWCMGHMHIHAYAFS